MDEGKAYVDCTIMPGTLLLPSGGFCLSFDLLNKIINAFATMINIFPGEFFGVGSRASVTSSPTNENLSMILRLDAVESKWI